MSRVRVAAKSEVPEGEARRVDVGGHEIAVVNLGEAGFRAIGDRCSHAEAYLHEGDVDMDLGSIECPRHGSTFDVTTGAPMSLPATLAVPVFEITVEGDDILIEVKDD